MFVSEVMTKEVIWVYPETPLKEVMDIFMKYDFDGVPVADENGMLQGLITQYDLVTGKGRIHLPTFIEIFNKLSVFPQDKKNFENQFEKIESLKAKDLMNKEPLMLNANSTIEQALKTFIEHHRVNPIPIIDNSGRLVGVISRYDLVKLYYKQNWDPLLRETSHESQEPISQTDLSKVEEQLSQYTLVSKSRSRFWLIASILFAILGFILAYAIIIRIQLK